MSTTSTTTTTTTTTSSSSRVVVVVVSCSSFIAIVNCRCVSMTSHWPASCSSCTRSCSSSLPSSTTTTTSSSSRASSSGCKLVMTMTWVYSATSQAINRHSYCCISSSLHTTWSLAGSGMWSDGWLTTSATWSCGMFHGLRLWAACDRGVKHGWWRRHDSWRTSHRCSSTPSLTCCIRQHTIGLLQPSPAVTALTVSRQFTK